MNWRVIQGDCLTEMANFAPGSFDAVITDPPYGMHKAEWDMSIVPVDSWLPIARVLGLTAVFTGIQGLFDYPRPDWTMAWVRVGSTQRNGKLRGFNNWEPILVYGLTSLANDVISVPNFPDIDAAGHPTPKPRRLMRSVITRLTQPGQRVLDPFCGSGMCGTGAGLCGHRD